MENKYLLQSCIIAILCWIIIQLISAMLVAAGLKSVSRLPSSTLHGVTFLRLASTYDIVSLSCWEWLKFFTIWWLFTLIVNLSRWILTKRDCLLVTIGQQLNFEAKYHWMLECKIFDFKLNSQKSPSNFFLINFSVGLSSNLICIFLPLRTVYKVMSIRTHFGIKYQPV